MFRGVFFVFLLNLVPFATNIFNYATDKVVVDLEVCTLVASVSAGLTLFLSLISRIAVIIGDVLVLVVTWMKTAKLHSEAQQLDMKAPLATLLVRDGTIYFIILLIVNALEVAGKNVPVLFNLGVVGPFFDMLPPLIVCRFIRSLRQVGQTSNPWGSSGSPSQSHSLRFIGNMGELLQSGAEEEGGHGVNRHEHPDRHDISPEIVITSVDTVKANEEGSVQVHGMEMVQDSARYDA